MMKLNVLEAEQIEALIRGLKNALDNKRARTGSVKELAGVIKGATLEKLRHEHHGEGQYTDFDIEEVGFECRIIQGPLFTAVEILISPDGGEKWFDATGLAKTHWRDKKVHSHKIGREIAVGRASYHLARKMMSFYKPNRTNSQRFILGIAKLLNFGGSIEPLYKPEESESTPYPQTGITPSDESVSVKEIVERTT